MPPPPATLARQPFHAMTKPIGAACNLDCAYCYYLEKSRLYTGPPGRRMSPEVLASYVRDYIAAQPGREVAFAWQGGEPTLAGLDFFREAVALQKRFGAGREILNAFQTNGTLLDDAWGAFFAENNFLVGISVDGPRAIHDGYRVDKGRRPTFDLVMRGLAILQRHRVEFNTLTTVHPKNARHGAEVYRFLRDTGSGFIQFIPIVERSTQDDTAGHASTLALAPPPDTPGFDNATARVTDWSVDPDDYGDFLCAVFDEWVKRDVGRVFVQHFDSALANWVGVPAGVCVFQEKCGHALAVEHTGDVYACDHYVYPHHRLGNLLNDSLGAMADSPRQRMFGENKSASLPRYCRECTVRFACHGECPKHRFLTTPDGEPGLNYLCAGYKKFFTHIGPAMGTMAALLARQQSPANIMRIPREQWLRAERPR